MKYVTRSGCLSRGFYVSVTIGWMLDTTYVIQLTTPCILRRVLSRIVWVDKLFCPQGRDEGHRDSHMGFARGLNPYNERKEEPLLSLPSPLTYTQVKRLLTGTHRNGTLDRGLDTTHVMFVTLRTIRALATLALSLFQNSNFFLS
jgi:hypothetical protein